MTSSCAGCHKGGKSPAVTITASPSQPDPGASTTLTIHIPIVNGPVGGFYLTSNDKGRFVNIAGQGTRQASATEMVHSAPKTATGNEVLFQLRWTAPASRGGVDFDVWAVSANNNRASSGDGEGHFRLGLSYGCVGQDFHVDSDGDGFGFDDVWGPTRACEPGPGLVGKGGDCDDFNKDVNPGHAEVCNFIDDNCDGKINEGLPSVTTYSDRDRDGYGAIGTTDTQTHCGPFPGYSATNDDCDDTNASVHPGAPELCDFVDNNCNGRADDDARASCGVGWCRRLATTCNAKTCTPGAPRAEMCNLFDDDCDGLVDNGSDLCSAGKICFEGQCLTSGEAQDAAAAAARAGASTATDAATGGHGGQGEPPVERAPPTGGCCFGNSPGGGRATVSGLLAAGVWFLLRRPRRV